MTSSSANPSAILDPTEDVRNNSVPPEASAPWQLYSARRRWVLLAILFLVSMSNYVDRNIIGVLLEPIKREFQVSDTMLGLLGGLAFALFYATLGLPVARWADRGNRRTVITVALVGWSIMTVLCGRAQTFGQLLLARVGVGIGESGAISPAQSLIADYFPPNKRATAIAIFTAAAMAGYLIGFSGGGYVAAHYGWRTAFITVGLPGLLLALIVWLFLAEPRQKLGFPTAGAGAEPVRESLLRLWHKHSYRHAVIGCCLYFFVAYGALIFVPPFLIRVLHVTLADVSLTYGAVSAVSSLIGTLAGGWLADRLSKRDIRWLAYLPAAACALAAPIYVVLFGASDFKFILGLSFVVGVLLTGGLPPVFAAIHVVCGSRRRALAVAIVFFAASLFGNGLGPLVAGMLSDGLSHRYGVDGLRYALQLLMGLLFLTGGAFFLFGRHMPADSEA